MRNIGNKCAIATIVTTLAVVGFTGAAYAEGSGGGDGHAADLGPNAVSVNGPNRAKKPSKPHKPKIRHRLFHRKPKVTAPGAD
ncbi:MAG: hypothetical protein ACRYG5_14740 [Janthinobacterium lividum]